LNGGSSGLDKLDQKFYSLFRPFGLNRGLTITTQQKTTQQKTTKQKILDAALVLFNEKGATEVSTKHLATALNMSPGNLYYHFGNKEEIIYALFTAYDEATKALFLLPSDNFLSMAHLEGLIEGNFTLQWQYRFLFRDLLTLLRRDPQLNSAYLLHRNLGFQNSRQLILLFAQNGIIAPIQDEQELETLNRLIWMISDFWLPSLELGGETVNPERFKQGIALLRRVSQAIPQTVDPKPQDQQTSPKSKTKEQHT
jgi:AcrR family transcriptional regulator